MKGEVQWRIILPGDFIQYISVHRLQKDPWSAEEKVGQDPKYYIESFCHFGSFSQPIVNLVKRFVNLMLSHKKRTKNTQTFWRQFWLNILKYHNSTILLNIAVLVFPFWRIKLPILRWQDQDLGKSYCTHTYKKEQEHTNILTPSLAEHLKISNYDNCLKLLYVSVFPFWRIKLPILQWQDHWRFTF